MVGRERALLSSGWLAETCELAFVSSVIFRSRVFLSRPPGLTTTSSRSPRLCSRCKKCCLPRSYRLEKPSRTTRLKSVERRKYWVRQQKARRFCNCRDSVHQQTTVWRRVSPTVYSLRQCNTGKFTGTTDSRRPAFVFGQTIRRKSTPFATTSIRISMAESTGDGDPVSWACKVGVRACMFFGSCFLSCKRAARFQLCSPGVRFERAVSQNKKRFS